LLSNRSLIEESGEFDTNFNENINLEHRTSIEYKVDVEVNNDTNRNSEVDDIKTERDSRTPSNYTLNELKSDITKLSLVFKSLD